MYATKNDLPLAKRKQITETLGKLLADAVDLQMQCKQAHWNVKGPNFIALHELFDKVVGTAAEAVDMIAERIAQLGGQPKGTVRTAAKNSRLKEYPLDASDSAAHVKALSSAIALFAGHARKGIDETGALGDAVTADMLTEVTRGLDQQLWFVEAHL